MSPLLFGKDRKGVKKDQLWLAEVIDQYDIFPGLTKEEIDKLVPTLRVKRFEAEEILCHCPDSDHDAFITLSGTVAITYQRDVEEYVLELTGFGSAIWRSPGRTGITELFQPGITTMPPVTGKARIWKRPASGLGSPIAPVRGGLLSA